MLPPSLAPPLPTRPRRRTRRNVPWLALLGLLLVVVSVIGTIVWVGALSPYGFIRFPLRLTPADRDLTISRAGTYLIFEEYAGATRPDLPSPLDIAVIDERGRSLAVDPLVEPGQRGAPFGYHLPPNEGRAVARFVAPRAGHYLLQIEEVDPTQVDANDYRGELPSGLAVGREIDVAWLRGPLGLVLFGLVPLVVGTVILVRVIIRRRGQPRNEAGKPPLLVR